MLDPNFKRFFNQFFIFPLIALTLASSLAMSQEIQMEELGSAEVLDAPAASEDSAALSSSIQSSTAGLAMKSKIKPAKSSQVKNSEDTLLGMAVLLVPHVAIVSSLIAGLGLIWLMLRWRELVHREHLAAIEKGIRWSQMSRQRLMLWGMVWVALGLAASAALWVNFNWSNAMWGLMPLLFGFALLLYVGFFEKNQTGHPNQAAPTA